MSYIDLKQYFGEPSSEEIIALDIDPLRYAGRTCHFTLFEENDSKHSTWEIKFIIDSQNIVSSYERMMSYYA